MSGIAEFMSKDHDRLETIFKDFQNSKVNDLNKARELFHEFKTGLERHIVWEEEILFPIFEQRTGMNEQGPTAVMRIEHKQIQQFLQNIQNELPATIRYEEGLIQVLSSHNMKEENILYPWIDHTLSESEISDTLKKMKVL